MRGKYETPRRSAGHLKILALAAILSLLCSLLPTYVFAVTPLSPDDYLCGHSHSESCGFVAGSEGTPCTHVHDEGCVCEENASCAHIHDDGCGYTEPVPASPCTHICNIITFINNTPGAPFALYQAEAGETYDSICAALPQTLFGTLSCTETGVNIPVRWSCAEFTGEAGTYTFSAIPANNHCVYTEAGGTLPFITVTVPAAAPEAVVEPEPVVEAVPEPVSEAAAPTVYSISHDVYPVTISGTNPQLSGARLVVETVSLPDAQVLLGETDTVALFAYDIKIMIDDGTGEKEYQPGEDDPVTVTITPPEAIEAPAVEVVHIAVDEQTGTATPQTVADVTTTADGSVEFKADGFSVYVISVVNSSLYSHVVNFPLGDYRIEYNLTGTGNFTQLTSTAVTLGGTSSSTNQYDALYFKVVPNLGLELDTVSATGGALTHAGDVYTLNVSGEESTTITISVTGVQITGTPTRGDMLTAAVFANSGNQFIYTWQAGNIGNFTTITGQTGDTFTLPTTDNYDNQYIQVVATDGINTYTSAPVGPVSADRTITFDLAKGTVEIGLSADGERAIYRGFNSANVFISGTHADTNKYVVTQSNSSPTNNRIIFTGNNSSPLFDVTLSGVNCATDTNKSIGGIYADALTELGTPMHLILRLEDNNYVGRIHYATSGQSSLSNSTAFSLTITSKLGAGETSGYLEAASAQPWSAAIGGVDSREREAARNIYILGGTIKAIGYGSSLLSSNTGTSAIGGGGNGACNIVISGGNVTATNNGTGATIGGGGGNSTEGGEAAVTITGGTVTATNKYIGGVAIGGGCSIDARGSVGNITISGGNVTTTGNIGGGNSSSLSGGVASVEITGGIISTTGNIGGGNSLNLSGGVASVEITGGIISTTGNIGGGNSINGSGGEADIDISGGTISAEYISGGHGAGGEHAGGTLSVTGGSAKVSHVCPAITATGVDGLTPLTYNVYVSNGGIAVPNAAVTDVTIIPQVSYGLTDVYTDSDGRLYLWLPTNSRVDSVTALINGIETECNTTSVQAAAYITPAATKGFISLGQPLTANLSQGVTATSYSWQKFNDGVWTPIGVTTKTFTPGVSNIGELRVVINDTYTSASVFICQPTFIVTIPEEVNMNTTSFGITGQRTYIGDTQSLIITVAGGFELALTDATDNTLDYTLYTDAMQQNAVAKNGTGVVASFTGNGSSTVPIYYTVIGTPRYSGDYTDTLTFTVTFDSGS